MMKRARNRRGDQVKGIIKAAVILCLIVLLPFSAFADNSYNLNQDGFSTSYS